MACVSENISAEKVIITLSGLSSNFDASVELFETLLSSSVADEEALANLKLANLKQRADDKLNKQKILWSAMMSYAKFGANSSFLDKLSEEELNNVTSTELIDIIHNITSYNHRILYYGPEQIDDLSEKLSVLHANTSNLKELPEGKIYKGLYPECDQNHPVDLMGYSFGGITSRMLLYLLNNMFVDDATGSPDESMLLGSSLPGWVKSITSLSTPHNGATISNIVTDILPFTDNLLPVANMISSNYYDFDLDHWGISKKEKESWPLYLIRLKNHTAWTTKNNVGWDSSIQGAKELNDILIIDTTVHYFSYATTASVPDPVTGFHVPDKHLSWTNYPLCWFMG